MSSWSMDPDIGNWSYLLPTNLWGHEWRKWINSNGKEGEKPPEDILKIVDLVEQAKWALTPEERIEFLKEADKMGANLPGLKTAYGLYEKVADNGGRQDGTQALIKAYD